MNNRQVSSSRAGQPNLGYVGDSGYPLFVTPDLFRGPPSRGRRGQRFQPERYSQIIP
ncbi:hypothetical protein [Sphingomonas sp. DBB INV C78]|uniref:hypothetical protein n=1 Tax=Sphingomonas sp. DBB INV C78 TaxID=3349434 RepID=UPI0036D2D2BC